MKAEIILIDGVIKKQLTAKDVEDIKKILKIEDKIKKVIIKWKGVIWK